MLLFYPKDFTLICPTELVAFGEQLDDFTKREAVVLGGSTDNEYSHLAWRQSDPRLNDLPYPLIAAQKLAADLGILGPSEHVCLRSTFLVDPEGTIQWVSGQTVQSGELTACNWQPGQKYVAA